MFSLTTSPATYADDTHVQPAEPRPRRRLTATPNLDEAYEMRLLAEVARWDDQAAFEELYALHAAAVKRVALQICRNAGIADEIVQHTFTALWVRAERLIYKSVRLRPWLTTVARNAAIDHIRGERPGDSIEAAERIAASDPRPDDAVLQTEAHAELAAALATLSANQRAAVELVYFAGATYEAAAATLGEPVGTIKSRVRLALGHLRTRLTPVAV
jgi:RNA polymerase sigma factor (sigma-70 family)